MDAKEIEQLLAEETLDIKKYVNLTLRYWYWFAISLVVCMALAYILTKSTHNVYQVDATILIRDDKNRSSSGAEALLSELSLVNNTKSIQNEIGILKSYTLAFNTVKDLPEFKTTYKLLGKRMVRHNVIYKDFPFNITYDTTCVNPTGKNIFITFIGENRFEVKTDDHESEKAYSFGQLIKLNNFGFTITPTSFFNKEAAIGRTFILTKNDLNSLAKLYQSRVTINLVDKNASLISLSSTGESAEQEADYLNKLIQTYISQSLEEKNQIAKNTINFIDDQLFGMRDSLKKAEVNLRNFRVENRILDVNKESSMLLDKMKELQTNKATIDINKRYYSYLKTYLAKRDSYTDVVAPYTLGINDIQLANLLNELSTLSNERQNLKLSLKDNNPTLIQLDGKIRNVKNGLTEKVNSLLATNKLANDDINEQVGNIESKIALLPSNEQQLFNKTKVYDLLDKMYTYLLEKKSEASIAKASNISDCKIVDPALPINAVLKQPKPKMNYALGFILGLLIPLITIILRDYFDNKIRAIKDLTKKLSNVPLLATLDHSIFKIDLPVKERPKSRLSESFRTLRTNINFVLNDNKSKVIMVSSLISGEGKTFCATNLAAIFASSGKKTLLIGLDLRKPKIQTVFETTNHKGISSYLSNQSTFEDAVKPTDITNLWLAVSGAIPPNPSELIGSPKMDEFFSIARKTYDCIIIDTPPIGIVTDARIIFNNVDLVLFVTRIGVSPKDVVDYCKDLHTTLNNKLALVVNDFDSKKSHTYYSKYRYKYSKENNHEYYEN